MRYHILLLFVVFIITFVNGENKNETIKKKTDKRSNDKEKKLTDKRELDEQQYDITNGGGTAFSYTHVIQNHGRVKKVIHVPFESDIKYTDDYINTNDNSNPPSVGLQPTNVNEYDYNNNYYGSTKEQYNGPTYVTAKPVLPTKEDYLRSRAYSSIQSSSDNSLFKYPQYPLGLQLFKPAYSSVVDKQYTVPLQVLYRVPLERNFGYHIPNSYDLSPFYNPYLFTTRKAIPDNTARHYLNSASSALPYHAFLVNNFVGKTNSDSINDEENDSTNSFTEDNSK